jgi:2-polyprenyl-3-methyl-5-hydroxy-6-metoxy-1,4-benzoquinol methylase
VTDFRLQISDCGLNHQTLPRQQFKVAAAFDALATRYDDIWTNSIVGRQQRESVWRAIDGIFTPGGHILDLGCGTGIDAAHLARAGFRVHAIDISEAMLEATRNQSEREGITDRVTSELRALEDLPLLQERGPFDGAVSNFGVFNCVPDLHGVASSLAQLIRPGGTLAICSMGRFCFWESLWYLLHARLGKAFRRWSGAAPTRVWPEGRNDPQGVVRDTNGFAVFYPTVAQIASAFGKHFRLIHFRSVGVFVPPSCMEACARAAPALVRGLGRLDSLVGACPGLRAIGDHRLLILVRS